MSSEFKREESRATQTGGLSVADKRALAERLLQKKSTAAALFAQSYSQAAMWFLHQLDAASTAYHVAFAARICSTLDAAALECALQRLLDRHPMLRTTFANHDTGPVQTVANHQRVAFDLIEAEGWAKDELHHEVLQVFARPFDLERGPVLRVTLFWRPATADRAAEHVLLVVAHHIIMDGWSIAIFLNELMAFYRTETGAAPANGASAVLPALNVRYADYVLWQHQLLSGPEGNRLEQFWQRELSDLPPSLALPTDYARPPIQVYDGATALFTIDAALTAQLRTLARAEGVTLYMLALAAWHLLLARISGQDDLLIGSPMAGRDQAAYSGVIGDFVNMVVLRLGHESASRQPRLSVRDFLRQVRGKVLAALDHQEYPFALLVERLRAARDASRTPVFQVSLDWQKLQRFGPLGPLFLPYSPDQHVDVAGLTLQPYFIPQQEGQLDLALQMVEADEHVYGALRYSTALFEPDTIIWMHNAFTSLLETIVTNPDQQLANLEIGVVAMSEQAFLVHLRQLDIKIWVEGERLRVSAPAGRMTPELQQEIGRRKQELIALLNRAPTAGPAAPSLKPVERQGPMPLSFAQQRLWFLDQMNPGSSAYNMVFPMNVKGKLQIDVLRRVLSTIVSRHEVLRSRFVLVDGQPAQVADAPRPFDLPLVDLQHLPLDEAHKAAIRRAEEEACTPFDLAAGPLLRGVIMQLGPEEYALVIACHHIISDGWSIGVMTRELMTLYDTMAAGKPASLPPLPIQYADYAWWQRQAAQSERTQREMSYWKRKLAQPLPILDMPTDHPRPAVMSERGTRREFTWGRALVDEVQAFSRKNGVTTYMTLLAAFNALLYRYTRQEDILVGSPVAGREQSETEPLIGFFVNNIVLRTDLSGAPTFRQLLERVRTVTLEAYEHQHVPFDRLVEALHPDRDPSRPPFFQILFSLQNMNMEDVHLVDTTMKRMEIETQTTRFDLTVELWERPDEMLCFIEYCTDLFEEKTIQRLMGHYETLLKAILRDPDQKIGDLPLLTADERQQLLDGWNDTAVDYPRHQPVHRLFEAQAAQRPHAVAVTCSGAAIRYDELNSAANQLARHLQSLGCGAGALVGIFMDRSIEMVMALLAVHKAGAAYLPLDPAFPADRLAFMLEDSAAGYLIAQAHLADQMPAHHAQVVMVDDDWPLVATQSSENLPFATSALAADAVGEDEDEVYDSEQLAYVLYTSGSTGRPKGVQVPQRALVNFLVSMQAAPGMTAQDILLSVTTLSFDIAGLEIFLPLITGGQIEMVSYAVATDGAALLEKLHSCRATIMQATPATWRLLLSAGWQSTPGLKILCGGEAMPGELANQLLGRCASLWNMYGPTETTIWSTIEQVSAGEGIMPIGRPIANTQVYILDEAQRPLPIGIAGELYIGGDGVAHGYLNRPELTAEKFVLDPFAGGTQRMYRTGDLARWRADGRLEFLGRIDFQVKIRGFRIELGEIEAVLDEHPAVRQAVVMAREDTPGDLRLVAYLLLDAGTAPSASDLRSYLKEKLPDYMTPALYVTVDAFPLTPNGKVNRKALPAPSEGRVETSVHYVAPRNETERSIAAIWQSVLAVEKVGITDNFFDLGGHSLLIIQVHNQLRRSLETTLTIAQMFQYPTIEALAAHLQRPQAAADTLQQAQARAARQRSQWERPVPTAR